MDGVVGCIFFVIVVFDCSILKDPSAEDKVII